MSRRKRREPSGHPPERSQLAISLGAAGILQMRGVDPRSRRWCSGYGAPLSALRRSEQGIGGQHPGRRALIVPHRQAEDITAPTIHRNASKNPLMRGRRPDRTGYALHDLSSCAAWMSRREICVLHHRNSQSDRSGADDHQTADALAWKSNPGNSERSVDMRPLTGDVNAPGLYLTLVRWRPGYMSAPHTYTTDRFCVVVSGIRGCDSGADFDPASCVPVPAGGHRDLRHGARQLRARRSVAARRAAGVIDSNRRVTPGAPKSAIPAPKCAFRRVGFERFAGPMALPTCTYAHERRPMGSVGVQGCATSDRSGS